MPPRRRSQPQPRAETRIIVVLVQDARAAVDRWERRGWQLVSTADHDRLPAGRRGFVDTVRLTMRRRTPPS